MGVSGKCRDDAPDRGSCVPAGVEIVVCGSMTGVDGALTAAVGSDVRWTDRSIGVVGSEPWTIRGRIRTAYPQLKGQL